jgi:branched-chain amino acid transport system ATP-binding protein
MLMAELLRIEDLRAGYGEAVVLQGVSLALEQGQTLALLGRNGTGKTTLINTLAGATRQHGGRIYLGVSKQQVDLSRLPSFERAAAGIGWVPQERNIFKSLTVHENLTAVARPGPWNPQSVYQMVPRLAERKGNGGSQLSGGEQQMLSVARTLLGQPRLLLLDEPLEGLAPIICQELMAAFTRLASQTGVAVVLVEQKVEAALRFAQQAIVLERGLVVHREACDSLAARPELIERYVGVAGVAGAH